MNFIITELLTKPLYSALILIAFVLPNHSMGWAIIILTIIIRLILMPSSVKAAKAAIKMQLLQPKMQEIKARIKGQAEQNKALMELYKKEGVSPLGACLPMIVQIPIVMVLYSVFRYGLSDLRESLLYSFVPHIAVNTGFFGLDISKASPGILPIIAGLAQFGLSYLTMMKQPKTQTKDPMQMVNKQMIYLFPVMTIFIGWNLPAALVIYWIITTLFGMFQQLYVNNVTKIEKSDLDLVEEIEKEHENPVNASPKPQEKKNIMMKLMDKKLEKQAKKTGVNVTVRSKK